ncbi:MAG TPA: hypothetical protein VFZ24_10420 [Longimicrobiales bacterium]
MTQTRPSRAPAVIGFLAAGAVLLGASFLAGRAGDTESRGVPALELVRPTSDDTLVNPLVLEFRTPASLRLDADAGWSAGDLHLHAIVDGREIMPAAADITPRGASFLWRLPRLEPGTRRIHLTWAGRHHGNLRGPADTIVVHVRD